MNKQEFKQKVVIPFLVGFTMVGGSYIIGNEAKEREFTRDLKIQEEQNSWEQTFNNVTLREVKFIDNQFNQIKNIEDYITITEQGDILFSLNTGLYNFEFKLNKDDIQDKTKIIETVKDTLLSYIDNDEEALEETKLLMGGR